MNPLRSDLMLAASACLAMVLPSARAAVLTASDGADDDYLGISVSLSGSTALVGAYGDDINDNSNQGTAYVYRELETATGTVTESVKLTASDGAAYNAFGLRVSLSGSTALFGVAFNFENSYQGIAYVYRGLDTATGTVTESVKLTASDGAAYDYFGYSVSLSGTTALVGAIHADGIIGRQDPGYDINENDFIYGYQGAVYVYHGLDTATGTVTEDVKLVATDGNSYDNFGYSVSLSGTTALVGDAGNNGDRGAAYVYRGLDTATGTVTEDVKLIASDGVGFDRLGSSGDYFGSSVSLSGTTALVGADYHDINDNVNQGAAYVYRGLDTATGTVTEDVKLTASDGAAYDSFGRSVSLSGSTALVGANQGFSYIDETDNIVVINSGQGAAYIYLGLDTATGTVTENVKLTASDGAAFDQFGASVSLDGDHFIVGANGANAGLGKSYTGTLSSLTTLDAGNASRVISGISFVSGGDWIVGRTTDANQVTLSAGDTANVSATGKAVYIGQSVGSDNNVLIIQGFLVATKVQVGSTDGNTGNILRFDSTATLDVGTIYLTQGNEIQIEGDHGAGAAALDYFTGATLSVWADGEWTALTTDNFDSLATASYDSATGYISIMAAAIPEPSAVALLAGLGTLGFTLRQRRQVLFAPPKVDDEGSINKNLCAIDRANLRNLNMESRLM